jgi:hypothetical protein
MRDPLKDGGKWRGGEEERRKGEQMGRKISKQTRTTHHGMKKRGRKKRWQKIKNTPEFRRRDRQNSRCPAHAIISSSCAANLRV